MLPSVLGTEVPSYIPVVKFQPTDTACCLFQALTRSVSPLWSAQDL